MLLCSMEASHRDASFEYKQYIVLSKIVENRCKQTVASLP